ncbi:MAG: hypothetical protein ACC657_18275 [Thiohalomonadales bacterium]
MKNKFKLIPVAAALALGLSMSPANAFIHNWTEDNILNPVVDWGEGTADWIVSAAEDVGEFVVEEANNAADTIKNVETAFEDWITDLAEEALRVLAQQFYDQMADPMVNMADNWTQLVNNDSGAISRLGTALANPDDGDVKPATDNLVDSLFEKTSFKQTVQDFKDNGFGSILFMVGASGGMIASVEGDLGIAVSVDYILARYAMIHGGYDGYDTGYDGPVASSFVAVGIQVGMSSGASGNYMIGYHRSAPNGVGGLGVDVSLGIVADIGGGVSMGIDVSSLPWKVVTANIALSAGTEVTLDVGPSYAIMLANICSNGSIKEFSSDCVSNSVSDPIIISPERVNLILTVVL